MSKKDYYYLPFEKEYEKLNKKIKKKLKSNDEDWFKFKFSFDEQGKQGSVGILKIKNREVVFKTSQYYNHLVRHENLITQSLKEIRHCCPHFGLGFGILKHPADFDYRYKENIFKVKRKRFIENETLLLQYLKDCIDFTEFIQDNNNEDIIYSSVKQVLCALTISQSKNLLGVTGMIAASPNLRRN